MAVTQSLAAIFFSAYPLVRTSSNGKRRSRLETALAGKREDLSSERNSGRPLLRLRVSNVVLARSVVALLGLGFVDAGYSGDWSRIGVISKESEELLKAAAFMVVPLCVFLVFSFSEDT